MDKLPNPFVDEDRRFVLDEDAFMAELAEMPAFIAAPSPEYLQAIELRTIVDVLAGHLA
jgi:hypothetical protein